MVMLSLPCGWMCTLVGLPPMFGYIICGVLLGPSGLNSIKVRLCECASVPESIRFNVHRECGFDLPTVDGPSGDFGRAGGVLYPLCGRTGVLTRAPSEGETQTGTSVGCLKSMWHQMYTNATLFETCRYGRPQCRLPATCACSWLLAGCYGDECCTSNPSRLSS